MSHAGCPKCGATISSGSKSCGSCGAVSPSFHVSATTPSLQSWHGSQLSLSWKGRRMPGGCLCLYGFRGLCVCQTWAQDRGDCRGKYRRRKLAYAEDRALFKSFKEKQSTDKCSLHRPAQSKQLNIRKSDGEAESDELRRNESRRNAMKNTRRPGARRTLLLL